MKARIIPCLDIKNGRVVKGINFGNLIDAGDPVEISRFYDKEGADELCFLDITASFENRKTIFNVLTRTAETCFMPLTVGGGIRTIDDIRNLLLSGADKVSINTEAVHNPNFVYEAANKFGNQCIVVAIDAKKIPSKEGISRWEIFTHSGTVATGIDVIEFSKKIVQLGAGEILITSIDYDGTKKGYDIDLIRMLSDSVNVPIIASGGVGTLEHMVEGIRDGHAEAVLAASIFHFCDFSISQVKQYMLESGICVRLDKILEKNLGLKS